MSKIRRKLIIWSLVAIVPVVAVAGLVLYVWRMDEAGLRLAEAGKAAIGFLGSYGSALGSGNRNSVDDLYAKDYLNPSQAAWTQRLASEQDGVLAYEWSPGPRARATKAEMTAQLASYLASLESISSAKFKLDAVEKINSPSDEIVRALFWVHGTTKNGEALETKAMFHLHLEYRDGAWAIVKQDLIKGKTVIGDRKGFTDITQAADLDFTARQNPRFWTPEWEPKRYEIVKYASAGVSTADYDGDGWYDIFFADGASPRLYRNQGDGTFRDVTAEVGLPLDLDGVNVAIFADFDNDGDPDLFLGRITGANRLYRNDGGHFTDVTKGAGLGGLFVTVAAAGDYDRDGLLDLYIGRYLDPRTQLPTTLFYTRNGKGNSLLHNLGNLRFEDVTKKAGVREGGLTLGVAWADVDGDGYPDIYVANDFGRNALFHNNGDGTFSDVTAKAGALDFGYGMSTSFGDVNGDGKLDLYVSNVHSGQRWYGQATTLYTYLVTSLEEGTLFEDLPVYREIYHFTGSNWSDYGHQVVKGNSLLINDGTGHFTDVSEATGTNPFGWFWTSLMFDYDNDGDLDLYGGDGWISGKIHDDL